MKNIKPFFILILTSFMISCSTSNTNEVIKKNHPMIGTWEAEINGCKEKYTINTQGTKISKSNLEVAKSKFTIIKTTDSIYMFEDVIIEDSSKPDCLGSTSVDVGHKITAWSYVSKDKEKLTMCLDSKLKKCLTFNKVK